MVKIFKKLCIGLTRRLEQRSRYAIIRGRTWGRRRKGSEGRGAYYYMGACVM